jgi:DNA-binding MarR family transcriptional regulator
VTLVDYPAHMVMEVSGGPGIQSSTARALDDLLAADAPTAGTVRAMAAIAVDALAESNRAVLEAMREGLRRRLGVWIAGADRSPDDPVASINGVLRVVEAAVQRLSALELPAAFGPGTHAHRILQAIEHDPGVSNSELRKRLELDETEVSRTGRRLREAGLATRRRFGTVNSWTLSPAGERLLGAMPDQVPASMIAAATERVIEPEHLTVSLEDDRATVTAIAGNVVLGSRTIGSSLDQISERLISLAEHQYGVVIGRRTAAELALALATDRHEASGDIALRGRAKDGRRKTVVIHASEASAPLLVDGIASAIGDIIEGVGVDVADRLWRGAAIRLGTQPDPGDFLSQVPAGLDSAVLDPSFLMARDFATKTVHRGTASVARSAGHSQMVRRAEGATVAKRSKSKRR